MSGNINGSQLDCSTRGDRLGLLSLQFRVLIYRLSLQHLPCGNIRQNDAGFVYSTAPSDCCSSFCLNTSCNKMRRSQCLIMLLFLSLSHSSQRTERPHNCSAFCFSFLHFFFFIALNSDFYEQIPWRMILSFRHLFSQCQHFNTIASESSKFLILISMPQQILICLCTLFNLK